MTLAPETPRSRISTALLALLVIAVIAIAAAAEFDLIDMELAKRGVGGALALLLLVLGNQLPKLVLPLAARRANPGPVLAAERFAATILVIAGLASLAVWIWWPADKMMPVASIVVLAGFGLAAANWARVILAVGGLVSQAPEGRLVPRSRMLILMLLHALLWVAVIFLADSIWGDVVSRWLTVPALILNGVLAVFYTRGTQRRR
tara:strand:- start:2724 stop:3338 length:615 start_codon:yes stop_codon:yes gene_type:complete